MSLSDLPETVTQEAVLNLRLDCRDKEKIQDSQHQINQLKEEIEAKEVALAKEHFEHKKKDQTLLEHSRELEKKKKEMDAKR
jgi:hypothetical protein